MNNSWFHNYDGSLDWFGLLLVGSTSLIIVSLLALLWATIVVDNACSRCGWTGGKLVGFEGYCHREIDETEYTWSLARVQVEECDESSPS